MGLEQLLILQFIAHLLTDFTFQPDKKAKEKNDLGFKSKFLKWHILVTFGISWLLSFQLYFIFGAIAIAITHWVVDGVKKHLNNHNQLSKYAFFIDQTLHLFFIISVVLLYNISFEIKPFIGLLFNTKYLLIIAAYILCTKPANIFVKEIFNAFEVKIDINEDNDLPNAGKLIGIIERFLVLTFIIINQFEAVGFLIAAKSVLRYKDDSTLKTEYVLIGTMLSFGIAIAIGIIINLF